MVCPYFKHYPDIMQNENSLCPEENCYTVQAGDTLYTISRFYNVSLDNLIEANPSINPELITIGQVVHIPLSTVPLKCPPGATTYVVKKGDTFYSIAKSYKMHLSPLLKANPNINPDGLLTGQSICIPMIASSYINEHYRIKLIYPYRWSKISNERYEGIDGFFHVAAISSNFSISDICNNEAHHKLKPYGSKPSITKAIIASREGCLIMPSLDQPMEMRGQAALIVEYDKPIEIKDTRYEYLIIWADKNHIKEISDTLEFLD